MVNVEFASAIYAQAPDEDARTAVLDDDATQIVHVVAKWHLDEVRVAANGTRPCPVFEVVLTAAHWPMHVDWTFTRYSDPAAIAERHDLAWIGDRIGRSDFAAEVFGPPPGKVTIIHFDQAYRDATGTPKMSIFSFDIRTIEDFTHQLMALPEYRRNHAPGQLHYDW